VRPWLAAIADEARAAHAMRLEDVGAKQVALARAIEAAKEAEPTPQKVLLPRAPEGASVTEPAYLLSGTRTYAMATARRDPKARSVAAVVQPVEFLQSTFSD